MKLEANRNHGILSTNVQQIKELQHATRDGLPSDLPALTHDGSVIYGAKLD